MSKELYVGSLSYDTTEHDLEKLFSVSGRVTSIHLITDSKTGEFKGCGYVRMSTEAEAKDAIASLDGALLIDKKITVSIANPQKMKPQGGGYKGKAPGAPKAGGAAKERAPKAGGAAKERAPKTGAAAKERAPKAVAAAKERAPRPAAKSGPKFAASKTAPRKGGK